MESKQKLATNLSIQKHIYKILLWKPPFTNWYEWIILLSYPNTVIYLFLVIIVSDGILVTPGVIAGIAFAVLLFVMAVGGWWLIYWIYKLCKRTQQTSPEYGGDKDVDRLTPYDRSVLQV